MTVTINFKLADDEAKDAAAKPAAPGEAAASGQQLRPVKEVRPAYPAAAITDKVTGQVIVDVTVDARGRVTDAAAVSGPDALREAALTAARQWEFAPPAVAVKTTLEFQFALK
jgi:protein TonB